MDDKPKQTEETITTSSSVAPGEVVKTTTQTVSPELSAPITEETVTTSETLSPELVTTTTKTVTPPVVTPEHPQKVFQKKKRIFRAYQIIWYVLAVIEFLLAFRMVLKALGANPASTFAQLIYTLSDPFALPFNGLFGTLITQQSVFEWSTIVAAGVYALVAFGIVQLIHLSKPVSKQEIEQAVDAA